MQLVYIWLGDELPSWVKHSINYSNKSCGLDMVLICSKKIGLIPEVKIQVFLEDFYEIPKNIEKKYFEKIGNFRSGFWIKTIERYFVLFQYMQAYKVESLFHAELDNIVFDVRGVYPILNSIGKGVFLPTYAEDKGIGSLIYVNDLDAIADMCSFYLENDIEITNDMQLLGLMVKGSKKFYRLPTEKNILNGGSIRDKNLLVQLGGIFDAAAIGQYILGIDPRNANGVIFNLFENDDAGTLMRLSFDLDTDHNRFIVLDKYENKKYSLFNLHIHSKIFELLINKEKIKKIIHDANLGKKNLVSWNFENWYFIRFFTSAFKAIFR